MSAADYMSVAETEFVWPGCCSCKPGDGTEECESFDACYAAWHRYSYPHLYDGEAT